MVRVATSGAHIVAFVLIRGQNSDDPGSQSDVFGNGGVVTSLGEDRVVVINVDYIHDDGGRGGFGAQRRVAAVVFGHHNQMITLLGFAIQRATTENSRGRFDAESTSNVATDDRI